MPRLLLLLLFSNCATLQAFLANTRRSTCRYQCLQCNKGLGAQTEHPKRVLGSDDEDDPLNMIENIMGSDSDIEKVGADPAHAAFESSVKLLIGELTPQLSEITPAEKFQQIYKDIKSAKSGEKGGFDSTKMLASLFEGEPKKDPFDEKKVMIKLRNLLNPEDLDSIFKDPVIGDWI